MNIPIDWLQFLMEVWKDCKVGLRIAWNTGILLIAGAAIGATIFWIYVMHYPPGPREYWTVKGEMHTFEQVLDLAKERAVILEEKQKRGRKK